MATDQMGTTVPVDPVAIATADYDADMLGLEIQLEEMFNKNQLMPRIREELMRSDQVKILIERFCEITSLPEAFPLSMLAQLILHKRADVGTMVGLLWRHVPADHPSADNPFQEAADALDLAVDMGLVVWDDTAQIFITAFVLSDHVQAELDAFQYPLPMVVKPLKVLSNSCSPYISVKNASSVLLNNAHHDGDVCLDHINRMNAIPFTLNMDTVNMVRNRWRSLDKVQAGESVRDYQKRRKAFDKYDRTSRLIIDNLDASGNLIYLTHKYDKRGRTYCQGYHINYQGTDWNKAVVELAHKEIIP